jgi:hypothetical protein
MVAPAEARDAQNRFQSGFVDYRFHVGDLHGATEIVPKRACEGFSPREGDQSKS